MATKSESKMGKKNPMYGVRIVGEQSSGAKLTEGEVLEIREMIAAGRTDTQIGWDFNVTPANIRAIRLRKTWKHV